jgi:hypothetical protein
MTRIIATGRLGMPVDKFLGMPNNSDMRTSEALQFYGDDRRALAEALDIKVPSTYEWGEFPPPLRQIQLEQVTGGALKAEPNVFEQAKRGPARKAEA